VVQGLPAVDSSMKVKCLGQNSIIFYNSGGRVSMLGSEHSKDQKKIFWEPCFPGLTLKTLVDFI
jgi:hypothetical protein